MSSGQSQPGLETAEQITSPEFSHVFSGQVPPDDVNICPFPSQNTVK